MVAATRVVAGLAVLLGVVALVLVATSQLAGEVSVGGAQLLGSSGGAAGQYGSISGMTHIFWGEQEGMPGRYPPEYAQQLKSMRTLIKVRLPDPQPPLRSRFSVGTRRLLQQLAVSAGKDTMPQTS